MIPDFVKPNSFDRKEFILTRDELKGINTVCIEANCPNRYECFSKKIATFMILGNICTRNCKYCNVTKGKPLPLNLNENIKIAEYIAKAKLKQVVITCVTRDDLEDGGASNFVDLINKIREKSSTKIELLISDLKGDEFSIKKIVESKPDIIGHNIETVERLFDELRPNSSYKRSLEVLKLIKKYNPKIYTKSGIMVGLGETISDIKETIDSLDCDFLSIGQYLQPTSKHFPVQKYYTLNEFNLLKKYALSKGFKHVEAGPLVRSSYHASEYLK